MLVQNASAVLERLDVRIAGSDLSGAGEDGAAILQRPTAMTLSPTIDLGGGGFDSEGGNCLFGNGSYNVETSGFVVSARGNWWGDEASPGAESASPPLLSSVDTAEWLTAPPPACS